MVDDADGRRSSINELGKDVKSLIAGIKSITELLPLLVAIAAVTGGALMIGYASQEHFFYDLSSISAITLLIITFLTFSFIIMLLSVYSFVSMLWISRCMYYILVWANDLRGRRVIVQLRTYVTNGWVLFYSVLVFISMVLSLILLYLQNKIVWPIVWYLFMVGFTMNCFVTTVPRPSEGRPPGESERFKLLFGFVGLPIVFLFYYGILGSLLNSTMTFLNLRSPQGQLIAINE